jgi:hypothetical protein
VDNSKVQQNAVLKFISSNNTKKVNKLLSNEHPADIAKMSKK